jgi:hypothetical protein
MPQYKRSTKAKYRYAGVMTTRREGEEPEARFFRSKKVRQAVWVDAGEGCKGEFMVLKLPHVMDQNSAAQYVDDNAIGLDRVSRRAVRQQIEATRPIDGNPKTVAELQALLAKIDEVSPRPSAGR